MRKKIFPKLSLLGYGEVVFFYFMTFGPNQNLDLRSYGQILSLFFSNALKKTLEQYDYLN